MSGSFLSHNELENSAKNGSPFVDPFDLTAVQSASIDLRLGDEFYRYTFDEYKLGDEIIPSHIERDKFTELTLNPGDVAYVGLCESIRIPIDMLGFVFPRSTLTRLGVLIYPVYMNPGYNGVMPVTIINGGKTKVKIVPGARVAQLLCAKLTATASIGYGDRESAKYQDERVSAARHDSEDLSEIIQRIIRTRTPSLLGQ